MDRATPQAAGPAAVLPILLELSMTRFLLPLALFCFLASPVWAQDDDQESKKASEAAAEKLKADPNSVENIRGYVNGELRRIFSLANSDGAFSRLTGTLTKSGSPR
jgi:hypothetical protein